MPRSKKKNVNKNNNDNQKSNTDDKKNKKNKGKNNKRTSNLEKCIQYILTLDWMTNAETELEMEIMAFCNSVARV